MCWTTADCCGLFSSLRLNILGLVTKDFYTLCTVFSLFMTLNRLISLFLIISKTKQFCASHGGWSDSGCSVCSCSHQTWVQAGGRYLLLHPMGTAPLPAGVLMPGPRHDAVASGVNGWEWTPHQTSYCRENPAAAWHKGKVAMFMFSLRQASNPALAIPLRKAQLHSVQFHPVNISCVHRDWFMLVIWHGHLNAITT